MSGRRGKMKWGDWQSNRDTPWEAIIGMLIIALLAIGMVYMQEIAAWFNRLLEALS